MAHSVADRAWDTRDDGAVQASRPNALCLPRAPVVPRGMCIYRESASVASAKTTIFITAITTISAAAITATTATAASAAHAFAPATTTAASTATTTATATEDRTTTTAAGLAPTAPTAPTAPSAQTDAEEPEAEREPADSVSDHRGHSRGIRCGVEPVGLARRRHRQQIQKLHIVRKTNRRPGAINHSGAGLIHWGNVNCPPVTIDERTGLWGTIAE